jgi:hypothetical protein
MGVALSRIRDEHLFQSAGFKTFETYLRARWDFSKMRGSQLIAAANVVSRVNHGLPKLPAPTNERQVRELARVPEKDQPKAWAEAVKSAPDGVITAKHVAQVVTAWVPKTKPQPKKVVPPPKSKPRSVPEPEDDRDRDADSALIDLDEDIERHLKAWSWSESRFVAALEGWARRARAYFDSKEN